MATHRKEILLGGGLLIAVAAATQLTFYPGFRFGPHPVKQGDTLYGILTETFGGSQYHAANVLEEWQAMPNPNLLYANRHARLRDGDTVTVRYNTLTITRPNGTHYRTDLVSHASIINRNVELLVRNLIVLALAGAVFALLYLLLGHGKNTGFSKKIFISLAFGLLTCLFFEFGYYLARVFI